MISQNPSTKTLSSNDTRKLGLKGALKICKFWNNGALKKHSSKAQIYSRKIWEG